MSTRTIGILVGSLGLAGGAFAQVTQRANVSSSGAQASGWSDGPAISADGRWAMFQSWAANLVPGDHNGWADAFVRDLRTGTIELVSVSSGGVQGNLGSGGRPSISADGRFVTFWGFADNLVPGDSNGMSDVFVRDRDTGTTERVSVDSLGTEGNGHSDWATISADGRYVAFSSDASNLVSGDTNFANDVFLRDRVAGTTERVSVDSSEAQGNSVSYLHAASVSADGRYVAFHSSADNLVPGDTNGAMDVFVRDLLNGTTERASVDSNGAQGNLFSDFASISADGRYVAFESASTNFATGDTNGTLDIFVRDRQAGTTERVSLGRADEQANSSSFLAVISAEGGNVSFCSQATNLVTGDTNGWADVFVRDRLAGVTRRVSIDSAGAQANENSFDSWISGDGRYVVFKSDATNLVAGDTNSASDIFVRDRAATAFKSLCHPGTGGVIGCPCGQPANPTGGCANHGAGATSGAVLSASGVAYLSSDTLVLTTSNHRTPAIGVLNVFFSYKPGSATPTTGIPSGAGVRCIGSGGDLRRLYTVQVFGGTDSKPGMGDPSVSSRSASFPGHALSPGETRYYFNVYRDGQASGPCSNPLTSTNLTNMGSIAWSP